MRRFTAAACAALALLCLPAATVHASVVIGTTRVVLPAKSGEATVRLSNKSAQPALVEAWVDSGDVRSTPDSANAPFLITPPLFRIEPHKDQSLRILFIADSKPLPTDRESLFWLNVLEIPPKPGGAAADKNTLQFAIRSRLKLFYRPSHLPGDSLKAPDRLAFKAVAGSHGVALDIHNPTPYFITISKLAFGQNVRPIAEAEGMVAPFGTLHMPLKTIAHAPSAGTVVTFTTINDYGAGDMHKGVLTQ